VAAVAGVLEEQLLAVLGITGGGILGERRGNYCQAQCEHYNAIGKFFHG
jgi:hypothetical protein